MNSIKKRLDDNYLLGVIKHENIYNIYLMPIAWWILNHNKYDPNYNPNIWKEVFRNHIYNVEDKNIDLFLKSIEGDKLSSNEIILAKTQNPNDFIHLYFFIDFDKKIFINGFSDIEVEEYLPNENWKGIFGNPNAYLPEVLISIFA